MAAIEVVLQVNTKAHRKGTVLFVSAADLARTPEYYKLRADVDAEVAQKEEAERCAVSPQERHRAIKAQLMAEQEVLAQQQAELRRQAAEHEQRVAADAVKDAARLAEEGERARREAELSAENERLNALLAEQKRTEGKILELRPQPAEPVPEKPADPPAAPAEKPAPPHLRKRGE